MFYALNSFYVDLDGRYYCSFDCMPVAIRRTVSYQRRAFRHNDVNRHQDDNMDEDDENGDIDVVGE